MDGETVSNPEDRACNLTFGYCPKGAVTNYVCPNGYKLDKDTRTCVACDDGYKCS